MGKQFVRKTQHPSKRPGVMLPVLGLKSCFFFIETATVDQRSLEEFLLKKKNSAKFITL